MQSEHNPNIYTVSQLNREVRSLLEQQMGVVWLVGEISNFMRPSSGHWYFTLKDRNAQIRCAMFRGNNRYSQIQPMEGQQVLVRAKLSLYEPRGDYQLIAEHMESAGDGLLKQQLEQLKLKLSQEGLFDLNCKKALPKRIERLGIITSASGAAIKDVLTVLNRRQPDLEIIIYPSLVQGQDAPQNIINWIHIANERNEVDALLLTRGGGSLEDLWCFNDEAVARAIFHSNLPTVSAVGHEIDVTISDLVADVRAPTPSAAAELLSEEQQHIAQQLDKWQQRLAVATFNQLTRHAQRRQHLSQRLELQHPQSRLQMQSQALDLLQERLLSLQSNLISVAQLKCNHLSDRVSNLSPLTYIKQSSQKAAAVQTQLIQSLNSQLERKQLQLNAMAEQLNIMSPLRTLARGYSVTKNSEGNLVESKQELSLGDTLVTHLQDGVVESTVTQIG